MRSFIEPLILPLSPDSGIIGDGANHPADALCVIEGADSSLQYDRDVKQRIYADAMIPCYLIINLRDRSIEVYDQPLSGKGRFGHSVTLTGKQPLQLPVTSGAALKLPARMLLP